VPKSTRKLDALAALLERTGGDPKRIEAVRRAQNFRRSWLDLAEILIEVRNRHLYEKWGYGDLYAYAEDELTLKRATVDKLTISYNTLERHAPQVLERDGVATKIPSYDAIEYFDRTVGELEREQTEDEAANEAPRRGRVPQPPDPDLRREFEEAVFNEGQPVSELRRRFDPHFFPKPKGAEELELLKKTNAAARKLAELIAEVDGLPETMVRKLEADLGKLRSALDEIAEPLREKVERATVKANKRALEARAAYAEQLVREADDMGDAADRDYEDHADEPARAKAPRKRKSAS
jgi:hypothetical protein